ncbi:MULTISPECIES: MFS transporter [unclassified Streptomyces]|uniref:MFS transporter n=1 Tax=unclassified Streptomyces TaxID=2593676 RepID=UPI003250059F
MSSTKQNPLRVIGLLPRRAQALLVANAVNSFGAGLVMPFLLVYFGDIRGLDIRIGPAAIAVTGLCSFGSGLVWGHLLDKLSYRLVMPVVMIIAGVGTGLYAIADRPWIALAVSALYGLGMGGVGTVTKTMFATVVPKEQRTLTFGLEFTLFNAFVGLGVLVGGLVASGTLRSYQLLYLGDGLSFVITAAAFLVLLPKTAEKPQHKAAADADAPAPSYRSVLRIPALALALFCMLLCATVSLSQFQSALPGYVTVNDAVTPGGISVAFIANVVVIVLAQFLLMPRLDGVRRSTLISASGVLSAASWVCVFFAGMTSGTAALVTLIAGVAIFSVAEVIVIPIVAALINGLVTDEVRGRTNALFSFVISGGMILGPLLTTALLEVDHGRALIVVLAVGSLLVPLAGLKLRRSLPDEQDIPAAKAATTAEAESDGELAAATA